ncbi:taste receptor type 2 member 7-like [Dromiciops gliroides]|uniref:taste receptor type 2 member 7-like n=1 Tax=Dromiciops gliroides TaxID=33562 RepID=UPI001CC4CCCE|nr:taste receptor type 2 member 7-like [Dromiciops gliroides]
MEIICDIVVSGEFFIGVLVNVFIGLVNFINWAKIRRVSTMDFIITGLAISRIILLWMIAIIIIALDFNFDENIGNKIRFMNTLWHLCSLSNAWLDACLNVFLFLKIANFSHPVFLWLKWRVDKVILRVLMGCLIIFLVICLPPTKKIPSIYFDLRKKANMTGKTQVSGTYFIFSLVFFYIGSLPPFTLCLVCCFLLVLSLWRHTQQRQLHITSSRDPSTEAHVKAMKFMISYLFFFLLYHVATIIAAVSFSVFNSKLGAKLAMIIMAVYPLTHSIILIVGNSNLRQAAVKALQKLRHFLRNSGKLLGARPEC